MVEHRNAIDVMPGLMIGRLWRSQLMSAAPTG